jgi:molybdate transport system substrate-binding protein
MKWKFAALVTGVTLVGWTTYSSITLAQNTAPIGLMQDPAMRVKVKDAKLGDIRVLATAAIVGPLKAVRAQAEKAVGKPLVIEYGSARGNLREEILNGEEFEVAILLPDVNAELKAHQDIEPMEFEIARVPVAIGVRGGVAVDVSTSAALKSTLLNAASVRYAPTGAAHDTVEKLLTSLAVGGLIKDSSSRPPNSAAELAPGQYEIELYPLSEMIHMSDVKNLGPVIDPFQVPVKIEAAIGAHANDRQAAQALIAFLRSAAMKPSLEQNGMTPGSL